MQTDELCWLSAWELHELLERRAVSAEEIVTAALHRIEALDPVLRAFITVAGEKALQDARQADKRAATGQRLGPLDGVPVAVKDEVWTAGIPSTAGSLVFRDFVPDADSDVMLRLRAAGAITIGKTNMPEFAVWPRSLNRIRGESVNPYDTARIAGASSGGSAAAVAAGMVPLAIGSDGGGSVRIPSSLCGVIGLHPTPGSVPDVGTFSYSRYASLGPIGRHVRDVQMLLQVMAGEPVSGLPGVRIRGEDEMRGLRVAFSPDFGYISVAAGIVDTVRAGLHSLAAAGAMVEEVTLDLDDVFPTFVTVSGGYGQFFDDERPIPYTCMEAFVRNLQKPENFELLTPYMQVFVSRDRISRQQYVAALAERERLAEEFDRLFSEFDVLVSPTMPVTAPAATPGWDTAYSDERMGTAFTGVVNILRLTAASYPIGMMSGLPVGLQVIGPKGREDRVLAVCRALELLRPGLMRPQLPAPDACC